MLLLLLLSLLLLLLPSLLVLFVCDIVNASLFYYQYSGHRFLFILGILATFVFVFHVIHFVYCLLLLYCCNHIFRNSGNKDTNYMLAILDSRMKIVAHERFQYVLLKKFGKLPTTIFLSRYFITLCIITDLSKTTKAQIGHYFRSHK